MKIGYYPGCSLKGSSREYNESLQAIAPELGVELVEIPDWNCCGSTAAHNLNRELSLALPARVLALAEQAGLEEVLVPCAACFNRLLQTRHELLENDQLRNRIVEVIGMEYRGSARIVNIIELLERLGPELESRIRQPFQHRVACYYGCLLVRPPNIVRFDRPEEPQSMDVIMRRVGADPIDWAFKTECCGAGFTMSRTDLVGRLCGQILGDAADRGAEAMVVACPMCHSNLDMRRKPSEKQAGRRFSLPVLYITQVVGLTLGIDSRRLGLKRHFVPVRFKDKKATVPPGGE